MWLRGLRSDDAAVRVEARARVWDAVYHQGTRWQASGPVVPFLVGLIDDPSTPDRLQILRILNGAVTGDRRDEDLPFDPDQALAEASTITEEGMARLIARIYHNDEPLGEDEEDEFIPLGDAAAVRWERDAWDAGAAHVDTIAGWVGDADPELAAQAAALLAWLPVTPRSVEALLSGSASANLTLAHLPAADPRIDPHLRRLLGSADRAVSVTAAVALAYRLGEVMPEEAFTVLVEAKDDDDLVPAGVAGWDRALRGFVSLALQRI